MPVDVQLHTLINQQRAIFVTIVLDSQSFKPVNLFPYSDTTFNNCMEFDSTYVKYENDSSTGNIISICVNCSSCCTKCTTNYILTGGLCLSCPQKYSNCKNCTDITCTECTDFTFYINGTSCSTCISKYGTNCLYCTSTGCTDCINTQYYALNGVCNICSVKYTNCQLCTTLVCTQCASQQYYLLNGTCVTCATIFNSCLNCDQTSCLQCIPDS